MQLKAYKGSVCERCGLKDIEILQFHHINPENKKFNLSESYNIISYDALKIEADKCELLCPNCHAKEHISDFQKIIDYYEYPGRDSNPQIFR